MSTGEVCSVCETEIRLERSVVFHHTSYEPERGMVVCMSCHSKIHLRDGFRDDLLPDLDRDTAVDRGLVNKSYDRFEMKVTTVRLSEELLEELDQEATQKGFSSRTEYIRKILETAREGVEHASRVEPRQENTRGYDEERVNRQSEKIAELEERVADLEARAEELEAGGGGAIAPTALATDTPGAEVEPSDAVVDALEASGWSHGRNREERERNAAVAAWALEVLRETDRECRRADVPLDALDDDRKPDTVWHQVVRPAILQVAAETDAVETSTNDQRYRWVGE